MCGDALLAQIPEPGPPMEKHSGHQARAVSLQGGGGSGRADRRWLEGGTGWTQVGPRQGEA